MSLNTELEKVTGTPVFLIETTAKRTAKFWQSAVEPIDPLDVDDCVLLVDARKETAYSNGDPVPTVQDFTGVMGDFTQASAPKQASFVEDVANGQPGFNFIGNDGIGDIYTRAIADLSTVFDTEEITLVMAVKWDSADQDSVCVMGARYPDDSNRMNGLEIKGNLDFPLNSFDFQLGATAALVSNPPGFSDTMKIIAARKTASGWDIFVDGVLLSSQSISSPFDNVGSGTLYLGGFADDFHIHWTGDIAVYAMYKRALTDSELNRVVKGLGDDYGIAVPGAGDPLWSTPETNRVIGVMQNGTPLTERSSALDVENNGGWYWDRENVYVSLVNAGDPRSMENTICLMLRFDFSTVSKNLDGRPWDARLLGVPDLSLRIEKDFSGVSLVGSGVFKLANNDGFFNSLTRLDWDAGRTTLKLGFDRPLDGIYMAYEDYEPAGEWINDKVFCSDAEFSISVLEIKTKLETKIPFEFYGKEDYPSLPDGEIGRGIQIAYGKIYGAAPVCISPADKLFKLAGHPIYSIDEVKVKTTSTWEGIGVGVIDLENAEFTVPDWDGESSISVDFKGKVIDGLWLSNPADIMQDFLETLGLDIHAGSFSESRANLVKGVNDEGVEFNLRTPSIYLDSATDAREVVGKINRAVGSYLFVDFSGLFRYVVFVPKPGEGLSAFTAEENFFKPDFSEETFGRQEVSSIRAEYAVRLSEEWAQVLFATEPVNQYSKGEATPITKDEKLDLSDTDEARYWSKRNLIFQGKSPREWNVKLGWIGLKLLPSDQVRLVYTARSFDEVVEIEETKLNIGDLKKMPSVSLRLGNLHGIDDRCGFVVNDDDLLPTRFSGLDGYGSGSLVWNIEWDPEIKKWARQNVAYVSDENGFADSRDEASLLAGTVF